MLQVKFQLFLEILKDMKDEWEFQNDVRILLF